MKIKGSKIKRDNISKQWHQGNIPKDKSQNGAI